MQEQRLKCNRLKEKCIQLNKENEFYNQAMTIFMTIKKVLSKQNTYLMVCIEREKAQPARLAVSKDQSQLQLTQQSIVRQGQGSTGGPNVDSNQLQLQAIQKRRKK